MKGVKALVEVLNAIAATSSPKHIAVVRKFSWVLLALVIIELVATALIASVLSKSALVMLIAFSCSRALIAMYEHAHQLPGGKPEKAKDSITDFTNIQAALDPSMRAKLANDDIDGKSKFYLCLALVSFFALVFV